MSPPSPSQLERIYHCPLSEALPHVQETSEDGAAGSAVHSFLEDVLNNGESEALQRATDDVREMWCKIDKSKLPPLSRNHFTAETSFAHNPSSGVSRSLGSGLSRNARDAMLAPGEMAGTLDLVGCYGTSVVVIDWKTRYDERVADLERNWQLRTYALMAARAMGLTSARIMVFWVMDDGEVWPSEATMDALDLSSHEGSLRELLTVRGAAIKAKPEDRPQPQVGPWCKYCPAMRSCPAQVATLSALMRGQGVELSALTPEAVAAAWPKVKAAKKLLEGLEKTLKQFATQTPVDMGEGYVLGARERRVESINPERALPAFVEVFGVHGRDALHECVEVRTSITKKRLEEVCGKENKEAIYAALERNGAIRTRVEQRVEEFKRK